MRVDGDDGAEGAVADVGASVALDVQIAVRGAGGDAVADGEGSISAGPDLLVAEFAVHLAEEVGQAVELAAGAVATVDHRVIQSVSVGVPPVAEDVAVHGEVVADDVEVSGGGQFVEGLIDPTFTESLGGGAVVGVLEPVRGGQLWGVLRVAFAEHSEHAAGGDGTVLGGVADESEAGAGGGGHAHEGVEVAVRERGRFVDHEDRPRVEREALWIGVGEVPGDGLALDPGRGGERACRLALHGSTDDSVASGGPRVGARGDRGGLARSGAADGGLEPVAALAPLGDQPSLLSGQVRVAADRGVDLLVGNEVCPAVETLAEPSR